MSKRREVMRVGGWLAVVWGVTSVLLAIATDDLWADLAGGYGLLVALAGMWQVAGLELLTRRERMAQARAENRVVPNRGALTR